jgi:hypothetical protein
MSELPKNGIMYPFIRVDGKDYNLDKLDSEELLALQFHIRSSVSDLALELNNAEDVRKAGGKVNTLRFNTAKHEREMMLIQLDAIGEKIKLLRKQEKRPLGEYFVDVAKERLGRDVFITLLDAAERRRNAGLP